MSIERRGDGWRVRWRDPSGTPRSRQFDTKRDAAAWDGEVKRRRRVGELGLLDAGAQTLAQFGEEWWQTYALAKLAPSTRETYAYLYDKHVLPTLGAVRLRDLSPEHIDHLVAELVAKGLAPGTVTKIVGSVLQGILQRAVEWRRIPANPCSLVRKPVARRQRAAHPLSLARVEAVRERLDHRGLA